MPSAWNGNHNIMSRTLLYYFSILLAGMLFLPLSGISQESENTSSSEVEYQPFDKGQWEKITKKAEFDDEDEPEEEVVKKEKQSGSLFEGGAVKYVLYALFGVILIFIIYSIAFDKYGVSNTAIKITDEVDIEKIVENLPESELQQYLNKALDQKSYRTAVRLYYLMVIQEMSNKGLIRWKKDKTNRDYLNEMRQQDGFQTFRKLTQIFERIWYGELEINQSDYQVIKPAYQQFIESVKHQKMAS